jgi:hypothetical protein
VVKVKSNWISFRGQISLRKLVLRQCLEENKTLEDLVKENNFSSYKRRCQARLMLLEQSLDQEVIEEFNEGKILHCPFCGQPMNRIDLSKKVFPKKE